MSRLGHHTILVEITLRQGYVMITTAVLQGQADNEAQKAMEEFATVASS